MRTLPGEETTVAEDEEDAMAETRGLQSEGETRRAYETDHGTDDDNRVAAI